MATSRLSRASIQTTISEAFKCKHTIFNKRQSRSKRAVGDVLLKVVLRGDIQPEEFNLRSQFQLSTLEPKYERNVKTLRKNRCKHRKFITVLA